MPAPAGQDTDTSPILESVLQVAQAVIADPGPQLESQVKARPIERLGLP
jgi:hypothetical protein